MRDRSWPKFSYSELLKPPDGWRTDHAVLTTYSADLLVIITSLLALSGCDLETRRTGTRVELVRAIEALQGRVRILAQSGRIVVPSARLHILKLLDRFVKTVITDESQASFHPKAAFLRFQSVDEPEHFQWRIWLGSRNLTRAHNWEAGLVLVSRADGKGQKIEGLAEIARAFAERAGLARFSERAVEAELKKLTWDCPQGCTVARVSLLGPDVPEPFPDLPANTDSVYVISPFLDRVTIRKAARLGGAKTRRTIVSTETEFQRLLRDDADAFAGFEFLCRQPLPDLPGEETHSFGEQNPLGDELAEDEDAPALGLHAKLLFASRGKWRQLWIGSANATARGWAGRNVEIIAQLAVSQDVADGLRNFVDGCERFTHVTADTPEDERERALEEARKLLSSRWSLRQLFRDGELIITGSPLPLGDSEVVVAVAAMGCAWQSWPRNGLSVAVANIRDWERTDFVQIRVSLGPMACSWLQVAPCDPPPDEERDHAVIAQFLDPNTFLLWLRSLLEERPVEGGGDDWDSLVDFSTGSVQMEADAPNLEALPTVEEILRAWARNADAFRNADTKVKKYLKELERRAAEQEAKSDLQLLGKFRKVWSTLSEGLR